MVKIDEFLLFFNLKRNINKDKEFFRKIEKN